MNNERNQFNKITKFITDSYNDLPNRGTIVVKSVKGGFSVNGIKIIQDKNVWNVIKDKLTISNFGQKRIAILFAALIVKKRYFDSKKTSGLDQQYTIFVEDKIRFKKILESKNNPIIESRLSKVEKELELLDQQLQELEKSLSLQ